MNSLSCKCMPANLPTFIFVHFCCVIRRINSNQMVSLNILNILWNQQFIFVTSRDHTSQVNSAVLLDFIHFSSIHELRNTLTSVMLYHQTLSSILNECAFQIFFCHGQAGHSRPSLYVAVRRCPSLSVKAWRIIEIPT